MISRAAPQLETGIGTTRAVRQEWIDALRGFALLGILLYNIQVFGGYVFRRFIAGEPAWAALDPALDFLAHLLIQGKFYSLFSFLFGMGFALQMQRMQALGDPAARALKRRLAWLGVFGLAHAVFVWFGDILTVYAVFGFALFWFQRLSQRALLCWALGFLASPILFYGVFLTIGLENPLMGARNASGAQSPVIHAVQAITSGSYLDVLQTQLSFYPGGWLRRAVQLALPRIFGMFLLGVWAVRAGLPAIGRSQRGLLGAWLGCGVAIGLPLNLALTLLGGNDALFPVGAKGLLVVGLASAGIPLLCLAYVAAFAQFWTSRPRNLLVSAGRMPLTQYLGQSIVCVGLFYGYGLGWFGRLGYGGLVVVALAVYAALALGARAWLDRFGQGPMEALWQSLSRSRPTPARSGGNRAHKPAPDR